MEDISDAIRIALVLLLLIGAAGGAALVGLVWLLTSVIG